MKTRTKRIPFHYAAVLASALLWLFGSPSPAAVSQQEIHASTDLLLLIASDGGNQKKDEIVRSLLEANPAVTSVDLRRSGDQITLTFHVGRGAADATFSLNGKKQDWFRLAVGDHPDDGLRALAGDPQIRSTKAEKTAKQLVLLISCEFAGAASTTGSAPPAPAAAAPPSAGSGEKTQMQADYEAAMNAGTPEALAAFKAKWKIGGAGQATASSGSAPAAAAPAAPPPVPTPPPAPQAPPQDLEGPYRQAVAAGTADALERFAAAYPSTSQGAEAKRQAERLRARESEAYQRAVNEGSEGGLQQFLASYPASDRRPDVEARLRVLQEARVRREVEQKSQTAEVERRRRAFEQAVALNTPEAYRIFLATYPGSPEEADARQRMAQAEQGVRNAENEKRRRALEQARAQGTPEAYRVYMATYPGSPEEGEARRLLAELEQRAKEAENERRRRAYEQAKALDTAEAYHIFVATYPGSPEEREAKAKAAAIDADEDAFEKAKRSETLLDGYLAANPKGRHAAEARDALRQMKEARAQVTEVKAALEALKKAPRGAEAGAQAEPPPEAQKAVNLTARWVRTAPTLDGRPDDPVWREIPSVEVPLEGPGGRKTMRVKAVHDGATLYLQADVPDGSRDATYRFWNWDPKAKNYRQTERLDDALSVAVYRGDPSSSCMLDGRDVDADIWLWRAFWSSLSRLADDGRIRASRSRIPQSNPYPARTGGGQMWIREDWDDGAPGWSLAIPVEYKGDELPSYKASPARGSRGDVRAVGSWNGGVWTVEFARALDTGNGDDVPLKKGETHAIAFAAFDKAEKARHSSSPVVRLEIKGR